jgi:succinate dehydrogenase / fumarate reductase iron-sulfur subunit
MAACPTYATDPTYAGPMPLGQAHRYNTDSRDGGFAARKQVLAGDHGPWRCHYAAECSRVCPKGVDPAKAIQLMKRELVLDYLRLRKQRCPSKLATKPAGLTRRPDIPQAPAPTVARK